MQHAPAAPPGPIIIRGAGDIGSTIAHTLFQAGHAVVLHDDPLPATTRRKMAFTDAIFDGSATLAGLQSRRVDQLDELPLLLARRTAIPVVVLPFAFLLAVLAPGVLIDARMRKRAVPEPQRGLAPLTIGLGPNFVAGQTTDLVVETSWEALGAVYTTGAALPLQGEPRALGGHGRERFVYAPVAGLFTSALELGAPVLAGQPLARIDQTTLTAPLSGVLRGLTHSGVPVQVGTKVIEVDPRGAAAEVAGLGTRPRAIARAIREVLTSWMAERSP